MARTRRISAAWIDWEFAINKFCGDGNYQIIETSYTKMLKSPNVVIIESGKFISNRFLGLMRSLKSRVKKRLEEGVIKLDTEKAKFYDCTDDLSANWKETTEIDLTSAYIYAAKRINAIDDELFEKLIKTPKSIRLMVMGTLGTKKTIKTFTGGKLTSTEQDNSDETAPVWHALTGEVDRVMKNLQRILKGKAVMYWTDAIFIAKGGTAKARNYIKSQGYKMKQKKILLRRKGTNIVASDGREFFFPKRRKVN